MFFRMSSGARHTSKHFTNLEEVALMDVQKIHLIILIIIVYAIILVNNLMAVYQISA